MYKILGIIVVVAFIIGALQVLPSKIFHKSKSIDVTSSKQVKADTLDADIKISAISFYEEYDSCKRDLSQTIGSCLKKNTTSSSHLVADEGSSQDPVFCSNDFPNSYAVDKITINDTSGQVEVRESVGGISQKVLLTFGKEANTWKVQKVTCPHI